jgi:hypothetical protein
LHGPLEQRYSAVTVASELRPVSSGGPCHRPAAPRSALTGSPIPDTTDPEVVIADFDGRT